MSHIKMKIHKRVMSLLRKSVCTYQLHEVLPAPVCVKALFPRVLAASSCYQHQLSQSFHLFRYPLTEGTHSTVFLYTYSMSAERGFYSEMSYIWYASTRTNTRTFRKGISTMYTIHYTLYSVCTVSGLKMKIHKRVKSWLKNLSAPIN